MATTRPTSLIKWVSDDASPNLALPPAPLVASGYTTGEILDAQHLNYVWHNQTAWLAYLSQAQTTASQVAASNQGMRLLGGGTLTYSAATTLLTWSGPLTIAIPSAADSDNQIAAGSVAVPAGSVAYVQANVPISTQADFASGATVLTNVVSTAGIATGMLVSGPGIPANTTVTDVEAAQLNLSQATTAAGSQATLSFASFGALSVQVAASASLVPAPNTVIIARGQGVTLSVGIGQTELWLRDQEARTLVSAGYGATLTAPAGQSLTANQAVYLSSGTADARTQGSLYPTDAGATNGSTRGACVGFTHTATASGALAHVVQSGILQGFSGLTQGSIYYLDPANPGGITTTMTSTLGQILQSVGVAISSTTLLIALGRAQTITNTFPNGAVITGNATASGTVSGASVVSGVGFKTNVYMGSYWNSSSTSGVVNLQSSLLNQNGSAAVAIQRTWLPNFSGSLVGIQARVYSSVAFQPTFIVYKNSNIGLGFLTFSTLTPSSYTSRGVVFAKGSYPFAASDLLNVVLANAPSGANLQVEADILVELTS